MSEKPYSEQPQSEITIRLAIAAQILANAIDVSNLPGPLQREKLATFALTMADALLEADFNCPAQ